MIEPSKVSPVMHRFLLALLLAATPARAAGVPLLDHVLVVVMENKNPEHVQAAPYIAHLIATGSSFSNYHAIAHPSQPNYIALWSGSTQDVTNNQSPARGTPWTTDNLGRLCEAAGLSWRSYSEDLPAAGAPDSKANGGRYTRKHDPWTNFGNLNHQNERPYADLALDIAAARLPTLAFVIPNNYDNMHSASVADGDAWLSKNMPAMLDAVGPRGIVVLTWDENDSGSGNQILTVVGGAPVKTGFVSDREASHYTLLRTICDALHLTAPGAAAVEAPITDIWNDANSTETVTQKPATGRPEKTQQ